MLDWKLVKSIVKQKYGENPLALSLAIHGLVLLFILISGFINAPRIVKIFGGGTAAEKKNDVPIIQAGIIDKKEVKKAIARQEQLERNKKRQLIQEKAKAEKARKETERMKLEAQKLKKEIAEAKKKVEQEKKLALEAKKEAAKAAKIVKEKEQERIAQEQARVKAEKEQQARANAAAQAAQQAERNRWLDHEFTGAVSNLKQRIYNHRTLTSAFGHELVCKIQIRLLPEGSIQDVRIIQSSGNKAYDAMSEAAVYKAAPFDIPDDAELVSKLRDIVLEFTNDEG